MEPSQLRPHDATDTLQGMMPQQQMLACTKLLSRLGNGLLFATTRHWLLSKLAFGLTMYGCPVRLCELAVLAHDAPIALMLR